MDYLSVKRIVDGFTDVWSRIAVNNQSDAIEYRGTYSKGDTEVLRETMRGQFIQLKQKGLSIRIVTM